MRARFHLWKATQDDEHLAEAKRLLDDRVEHAPAEYRESMLKNVRLNGEIKKAWAERGGAIEEKVGGRSGIVVRTSGDPRAPFPS